MDGTKKKNRIFDDINMIKDLKNKTNLIKYKKNIKVLHFRIFLYLYLIFLMSICKLR